MLWLHVKEILVVKIIPGAFHIGISHSMLCSFWILSPQFNLTNNIASAANRRTEVGKSVLGVSPQGGGSFMKGRNCHPPDFHLTYSFSVGKLCR